MSSKCLSMAYLLNYLSLYEKSAKSHKHTMLKIGAREGIHSSMNRLLRRTKPKRFDHYRCLRYGRLTRTNGRSSISCQRGYAKIVEKRGLSVCQMRSCDLFRDEGIVSFCYRPAVVREIKSVRFPPVSACFSPVKFDTAVVSPFHSFHYTGLPEFCEEKEGTQKCACKRKFYFFANAKYEIQFLYISLFFFYSSCDLSR